MYVLFMLYIEFLQYKSILETQFPVNPCIVKSAIQIILNLIELKAMDSL